MARGIDLAGQKFGKLNIISLVPEELRKNSYKRREWYCKCHCGKELVVEQRNITGKAYQQLSCGCIRVKAHLVATSKIRELTFEYVDSFDDYEKYAFLHKQYVKHFTSNGEFLEYSAFINKFYIDKQFNLLYNKWTKINKNNTFYDWYKPSLDHIVPKSRGGDNNLSNLQFLTIFENLNKRDMTMDEWNEFKIKTNTKSELYI